MGAELKIESDRAVELASALLQLTGETLTEAVIKALEERLARERELPTRQERLQRAKRLAREIREHMEHPLPGSDHSWLYDEHGLPR